MKTSNKADGIFSTDLLTNEVICIHIDGSVDVVVSNDNDNDEVGNIEHGVEMTVQNDESPKVFSFEECKAAAEQCAHVGEFILKFSFMLTLFACSETFFIIIPFSINTICSFYPSHFIKPTVIFSITIKT